MMSSVCTLRLKRRRAFSSDSPSCNLTSAKETTPPNRSFLDSLVIASKVAKVKHYMDFQRLALPNLGFFPRLPRFLCALRSRMFFRSLADRVISLLKSQAQGKLKLARCVSAGRLHEVGRNLVVGGKVVDSKLLSTVMWLTSFAERVLVSAAVTVSVCTFSMPLSEIP